MKDLMCITINPNRVRQTVKIQEAIDKLTYQMDPKHVKRIYESGKPIANIAISQKIVTRTRPQNSAHIVRLQDGCQSGNESICRG